MRILPDHEVADDEKQPRYLEQSALDSPAVALTCAGRETLRMGDVVSGMLARTLDVFRRDDPNLIKEVERSDDTVDSLHEADRKSPRLNPITNAHLVCRLQHEQNKSH